MFVVLKLLLHLFQPLWWIIFLFLYALLGKQAWRKKLALRTGLVFLIFLTNPFVIGRLLSAYELDPVQLTPTEKFETGIVLGGFASYSAIDKQGFFNTSSDRFIQTALLYKRGHIQNIIVAAGYNSYIAKDYFNEASFIKENLVQLGIPAERVYIDSQSQNTVQNALFAKRIADSAHFGKSCLLISSAMHLRRASIAFQQAAFSPRIPLSFYCPWWHQ
jgi:uncharacterized SAM-binding protein YcdF (DUF218 family)